MTNKPLTDDEIEGLHLLSDPIIHRLIATIDELKGIQLNIERVNKIYSEEIVRLKEENEKLIKEAVEATAKYRALMIKVYSK